MRLILFLLLFISYANPLSWEQEASASEQENSSIGQDRSFLQNQGISGSLRADYFSSDKMLDNKENLFGLTTQIKLLPAFNDYVDGKAEARFTNPDIGREGEITTTLLEGYVTVHYSGTDLRIGKQVAAWGRADGLNPTDNLTPRDFVTLLPFEEDQRFGTVALKLDSQVNSEYAFTIFTSPAFEPSRIPLPIPSEAVVRQRKPAHTFSNSEVGLKLNKTGSAVDWSVSYFHGYSLLPEIHFGGPLPTGLLLELRYPEIDVFGADVARNYGSYGFRAEGAYFSPRDYRGGDVTTIHPYLFYVLGVDRTFMQNLNINLQLVGRWVQNHQNPESIVDPIQRALSIENAVTFGQQDHLGYGLTSRINNKWFNDTLEAEVLLIAYFKHTNTYIRPVVAYAFTDKIKGSIGSEMYSGAQDSFFGRLRRNQGVFAEMRYSF